MGAMDDHNKAVAKIRAVQQQQTLYQPTPADLKMLSEWMDDFLTKHPSHGGWQQIGRCVYCSCGERLFQGTLPKRLSNIKVVDE